MLCEFSFTNFLSYRDETTFSMQAANLNEFSDSLIANPFDKQKFLPVSVLYGPNAGGKSNFFKALSFLSSLISNPISAMLSYGDQVAMIVHPSYKPKVFAFSSECQELPTEFDIFFRQNEYEYRLEIAFKNQRIAYEKLQRRKIGASRPALLYIRDEDNIELGSSLKTKVNPETSFNPALSYLAFLRATYNIDSIREAADFFLKMQLIDFNYQEQYDQLKNQIDEASLNNIVKFLQAVDLSISGMRIETINNRKRIFLSHCIQDKMFELEFGEESAGTQKLILMAIPIMDCLKTGDFIAFDELDARLHPLLIRYLVKLFKDPLQNARGSQLFFTCQNPSLMRNDLFRRDEIWFADRDENAVSNIWSLADIHEPNGNMVSKNAAFEKQYLSGRYGATPQFEDEELVFDVS